MPSVLRYLKVRFHDLSHGSVPEQVGVPAPVRAEIPHALHSRLPLEGQGFTFLFAGYIRRNGLLSSHAVVVERFLRV